MKSVSLITMLLCFQASFATTYGVQKLLQCPGCQRPIRGPLSLSSVYLVDRTPDSCGWNWSDFVPYCPPQFVATPSVVKCPRCSSPFWIEDAKVLGDVENDQDLANRAIDCLIPNDNEYYQMADRQGLSKERELYLRTYGWRKFNDARRVADTADCPQLNEDARQNLQRLVSIMPSDTAWGSAIKAEGLRELGRFDEALLEVSWIKADQCKKYADAIAELAKHRQTRLVRFRTD